LVALATLLFIGSQCVGTGGPGRAQEIPAAAAGVSGYLRPGAATYLALPRWYVVESAEEYAAFLDGGAPSGFPHLGALRQYWRHYRGVCATTRNRYPLDAGVHFTLGVAGVGFSAEHAAKGAYEATVGRVSEWIGGHDSAEDAFARRAAREYGQFLRTARIRGDVDVEGGWVVLAEPILTAPDTRRIGMAVPVRSLHTVLAGLARRGAVLERVYDY